MDTLYVISNPLFPEYVKVGYTKDLFKRLKTLSTGVPIAYKVEFQIKHDKAAIIERSFHTKFKTDLMVNANLISKEWYKIGEDEFFIGIEQIISELKSQIKRIGKK